MGGGSTGTTGYWYHAVSGQSGGRVMPGISVRERTDGYGHPQVGRTFSGSEGYVPLDPGIVVVDRRPNKAYTDLNSKGGAPGGGPGEKGANGGAYRLNTAQNLGLSTHPDDYAYHYLHYIDSNGNAMLYSCIPAAGGGGWGAAGGSVINYDTDPATYLATAPRVDAPGGAGGKAIQTNGNSVTWLGGQDRAYGAVG